MRQERKRIVRWNRGGGGGGRREEESQWWLWRCQVWTWRETISVQFNSTQLSTDIFSQHANCLPSLEHYSNASLWSLGFPNIKPCWYCSVLNQTHFIWFCTAYFSYHISTICKCFFVREKLHRRWSLSSSHWLIPCRAPWPVSALPDCSPQFCGRGKSDHILGRKGEIYHISGRKGEGDHILGGKGEKFITWYYQVNWEAKIDSVCLTDAISI